MRNSIFLAAACSLTLAACGGAENDLAAVPANELAVMAAQGDEAAMKELERRLQDAVDAEEERLAGEPDEKAHLDAMMANDQAKLKELADGGNVMSMTYLATMTGASSNPTEEEKAQAGAYLEQASEQGHLEATFIMGEDYSSSNGVFTYDPEKGQQYLLRAAEGGHPMAMYQMGMRYKYGYTPVEEDEAKAREWLEKARDAGINDAQRQLDDMDAG